MVDRLQGLGVSAGTAAGPALRMGRPPQLPPPRSVTSSPTEQAAAREALDHVGHELAERAARATDPAARAILEAQALIAKDPLLANVRGDPWFEELLSRARQRERQFAKRFAQHAS